ncbi:MAG: peptidase S41, partial [Bacteroidota bacterium]|nr:peptidase S41 [Bacteroidota bacterium]
FNTLVRKGVITNFVLSFVDKNRKEIEKEYLKFSSYKSGFEVDNKMLDHLLEMADSEGLERNEEAFTSAKKQIGLTIKALIARDIWDMSEYFEIMNTGDDGFRKAMKVLEDRSLFDQRLSEK